MNLGQRYYDVVTRSLLSTEDEALLVRMLSGLDLDVLQSTGPGDEPANVHPDEESQK